jgi:hypothetical protein
MSSITNNDPLTMSLDDRNKSCPALEYKDLVPKKTDCKWIKGDKVGSGKQATVYRLCCNDDTDCDYVVKFYEKGSVDEKKFQKEVDMHIAFDKLGLAVPILDAFFCGDHGAYIIMERRQYTIPEYYIYINDLINNRLEQKDRGDALNYIVGALKNDLINLLVKAYNNNLLHNDTHLNNFMINIGDDTGIYNNVKAIDFAFADKLEGAIDLSFNDKITKEINMSFELMMKNPESYIDSTKNTIKDAPKVDRMKESIVPSYDTSSFTSKKALSFDDDDMSDELPLTASSISTVSKKLEFDEMDDLEPLPPMGGGNKLYKKRR